MEALQRGAKPSVCGAPSCSRPNLPRPPAFSKPGRRQPRLSGVPKAAFQESSTQERDPFLSASTRLQNLLHGVGDGENELVDAYVSEESPESRLSMQLVMGGAVTGVSVAVCYLSGVDPWGGTTPSLDSLLASGVGLAAAAPLLMLRWWSWSPHAAKVAPALDDMHLAQMALQSPWFARTVPWHVAVMVVLEVLPMTLLLLPAAQGGLMSTVNLYGMALQSIGAPGSCPQEAWQCACLVLTALGASVAKGLELGVSDKEYDVVVAAVENSDRYYRLMGTGVGARAGSAAQSAVAFRSVAQAWMSARNDASAAATLVCGLDVLAMGALWYATGDLAAPAAAVLALNGIDAWHVHRAVTRREARLAAAGGSSSSGGGNNNNNSNSGNNSGPSQPGA